MRQQTNDGPAEVRCAAWRDPATGRINVTFVEVDGEDVVRVATDHDCSSRALIYDHEYGELDVSAPSPVTASLSRDEAIAVMDALDSLELVDRGPRLSQHVPGTVPGRMPRAGGAPWQG